MHFTGALFFGFDAHLPVLEAIQTLASVEGFQLCKLTWAPGHTKLAPVLPLPSVFEWFILCFSLLVCILSNVKTCPAFITDLHAPTAF